MNQIRLIFDIDGVLGWAADQDLENALYFDQKGLIVEGPRSAMLVFPGVLEIFQLLSQLEIESSFCSFGSKERNELFVEQLFSKAFNPQHYELVKKTLKISSRVYHQATEKEKAQCEQNYGIKIDKTQKDITKHLFGDAPMPNPDSHHDISNNLLVEDSPGNAHPRQIKNLFYVPSTKSHHFQDLKFKKGYNSEGFKDLKISLLGGAVLDNPLLDGIKYGKTLVINLNKGNYEITFLNKDSNRIKKIVVKNEGLIADLNSLYSPTNPGPQHINDDLKKRIYHYVDSKGGKTQKICRRANRTFYFAGLLFTAIENAQENKIPLRESLFSLQFKLKENQPTYEPLFGQLIRNDQFYLKGLSLLQKVNPQLHLNHPKAYLDCIGAPLSLEKEFELRGRIATIF